MSLMKKTTIAIVSSAVVLTGAVGAFAHDRKGGDREGRGPAQFFERVDANDDGHVRAEPVIYPLVRVTMHIEQAEVVGFTQPTGPENEVAIVLVPSVFS